MRIMIIFLLLFTNKLFSQGSVHDILQLKWLHNKSELVQLRSFVDRSGEFGLKRSDYDIHFIDALINNDHELTSLTDSVEAGSNVTQIANAFFSHIAYGKLPI